MKILHILKRIMIIILYVVWIMIFSMSVTWYMFSRPAFDVKNYSRDVSLKLLNKNILVRDNELTNILFSQWFYWTFQWDWWYNIIVELTDEWITRMLSNNTSIGEFEYKYIWDLQKCGATDNTDLKHPKEVLPTPDYKTQKFYYVAKERDFENLSWNDDWAITIYVDKEKKMLYLCTFR